MRRLLFPAALFWLAFAAAASAQSNYPTLNNQNVPATALLVPCGTSANGQTAYCPPGQANQLIVNCPNCSPSAPVGAASTAINGTVTAANTWQTVLAQSASRRGCSLSNLSPATLFLYFGTNPAGVLLNYTVFPSPGPAVAAQGAAYAVGDTIVLTGGTFSEAARLTVSQVSASGGVLQATLSLGGVYTVMPTSPVAQGSTTGGGSGATFNLSFAPIGAMPWYSGAILNCAISTNVVPTDLISVWGPAGAAFSGFAQ